MIKCLGESDIYEQKGTYMKIADIYIEREELLECDIKTGNIKVDKQIFDDFVPNTHINIRFVDTDSDEVFQYIMVAEDDDGIFMECLVD